MSHGYSPHLIAQMVRRAASPGFDEWRRLSASVGHCANPVHLAGIGPDGRAVKVVARCNNRRATVCPSCSHLYGGDTWQLVHAGLRGGHHDMPETISSHPAVFATLTAPSFGPVHTIRDSGRCQPANLVHRRRCQHGTPLWCEKIHAKGDDCLGQPLCADCYDYTGHALFAWHAPELWRRFTIRMRRLLDKALRETGHDPKQTRISFVKIVEPQRRALPHLHAVIRLDGATEPGEAPRLPDADVSAAELALLVRRAAADVAVTTTDETGAAQVVRFGAQLDTQPLTHARQGPSLGLARKVAGYLAKYVTKSVNDLCVSARRIPPMAIDGLGVSEHVRAILHTLVRLSTAPGNSGMADWLHTLGYRGHVTTKSRRYSITMTALRTIRATWQKAKSSAPQSDPPNMENSSKILVGQWELYRIGHRNLGERELALTAARQALDRAHTTRDQLDPLPGRRYEGG